MKKFLVLIFALGVLFALCACGSAANDGADNTATMPSEGIPTENEETENSQEVAAMSIKIDTETFTSGMSVKDVYAAAAKIGITEEVTVGGLLSGGGNYIVTGSIVHHFGGSDCSFCITAKTSGDLNIESEEALKQALIESGVLRGVHISEYGDDIIDFNYLDLDRNVTIDEVVAYMTEQGFENVERNDHSVQGKIGDADVLFGFDAETMKYSGLMIDF